MFATRTYQRGGSMTCHFFQLKLMSECACREEPKGLNLQHSSPPQTPSLQASATAAAVGFPQRIQTAHRCLSLGFAERRGSSSLEESDSKSNKTTMSLKNTTGHPVVSLLGLQRNKFTLFRGHRISCKANPTRSHTCPRPVSF